jgi:hypothetical protein
MGCENHQVRGHPCTGGWIESSDGEGSLHGLQGHRKRENRLFAEKVAFLINSLDEDRIEPR